MEGGGSNCFATPGPERLAVCRINEVSPPCSVCHYSVLDRYEHNYLCPDLDEDETTIHE